MRMNKVVNKSRESKLFSISVLFDNNRGGFELVKLLWIIFFFKIFKKVNLFYIKKFIRNF